VTTSSSARSGTAAPEPLTVIMLVTSGGLNDPRVRRSMQTAARVGLQVQLVCRPSTLLTVENSGISVVHIHHVPRVPGAGILKRMFMREPQTIERGRSVDAGGGRGASVSGKSDGPYWLRPREAWTLLGIAWFNCLAVTKMWRFSAALVHANDLDTLIAGVLLSRLKKMPLLYDAHELFTAQFTGASRQFRSILFGLEHWLIRYADSVVTVSRSIAETLAAWHGVSVPRVVMNCPSARPLVGAGVAGAIPRQRPLARVVYQGMYLPERGLEELILSVPQFDSAELYLRGYGDLEPALRALVEREGLQGRVHFLPPADPRYMVESLAGFDIGVVPYRPTHLCHQYCLPNKVFEYLQAGLALAVSALPELERLVKETETGELFDPERPDDIARAINALTKDPRRLGEAQSKARLAAMRYTWEIQGEPHILACYRELIGVESPKPGDAR